MREELLGEGHPETLSTRHNLAELFVEMSRPERSQELFQKNVDMMQQNSKEQDHVVEQAKKEGN